MTEYMKAVRLSDWKRCAELTHPDALQEFKDFILAGLAGPYARDFIVYIFQNKWNAEGIRKLEPVDVFVAFLSGMTGFQPDLVKAMGALEAVYSEALAFAQVHALLALGIRIDSLVTIVSAAALPELAPDGIDDDDDDDDDDDGGDS